MPRNPIPALLLLVILLPSPTQAQGVFGFRLFGGYNRYAMGDWNDIRRELFIPTPLFTIPEDGPSFGAGAEYSLRKSLSLTLSYERLVVGRMAEVSEHDDAKFLEFPCNAVLLEAEYRRQLRPRIGFGLGGGGGYYQLGEEIESPFTDRDLEGSTFGGQAFAMSEWDMTPALSLGLDLGYRWASVKVDKVNRQPPFTETFADYSGLTSRFVLRFLPRRTR